MGSSTRLEDRSGDFSGIATRLPKIPAADYNGIELVGHRSENQARALVVLAMGEITTMLGMEPKLLCGAAHENLTNIG